MTTELSVLAWGCILALVHIFAAGNARTRQYGVQWNAGPRDEDVPPPTPIVGRLTRAQSNYFETFPLFAAAVLIVSFAGLQSDWTQAGAIIWIVARSAYLPLYAAGIRYVRSLAFLVSLVGLLLVLWPALF